MESPVILDRLRTLFTSTDPEIRAQGVELLLSLDDPALFDHMLDGTAHAVMTLHHAVGPSDTLVPGAYFFDVRRDSRAALAEMCWQVVLTAPERCEIATTLRARIKHYCFHLHHHHHLDEVDLTPLMAFPALEKISVVFDKTCRTVGFEALEHHPTLHSLFFDGCMTPDGLEQLARLRNLRELRLGYHAAGGLRNLSQLTRLRVLDLADSFDAWVGELRKLTDLEELCINSPIAFEDLRAFSPLTALRRLELPHATRLRSLAGVESLRQLQRLSLGASSPSSLASLAGLTALRELKLHGIEADCDIDALGELPALKVFTCNEVRHPTLAPLARYDLDAFNCYQLPAITSLAFLGGSPRVARDFFGGAFNELQSLEGLHPDARITHIALNQCFRLARLGPLPTGLVSLHLNDVPVLNNLTGIERCAALKSLTLRQTGSLKDLSPLAHLTSLEELILDNASALEDLSALSQLTSLRRLSLRGCRRVTDLSALQALPLLEAVLLSDSKVARKAVPDRVRARCSWDASMGFETLAARVLRTAAKPAKTASSRKSDPLLKALRHALRTKSDAALDEALGAIKSRDEDPLWQSLIECFVWVPSTDHTPSHAALSGPLEPGLKLAQASIDRLFLRALCDAPRALTEALRAAVDDLTLSRERLGETIDLTALPALPALRRLCFSDVKAVAGIEDFAPRAAVRSLEWSCALPSLPVWPGIESLTVQHADDMDLSSITRHESLRHLACAVRPASKLPSLSPLIGLETLKFSSDFDSLPLGLAGHPTLRELTVRSEAERVSLELTGAASLTTLRLERTHLRALPSQWSTLTGLRSLELKEVRGLTDLGFLRALPWLEELRFFEIKRLRDLRPLAELAALRKVAFVRCPWVEDFSPLVGLPKLESVLVRYAGYKQPSLPEALSSKVFQTL